MGSELRAASLRLGPEGQLDSLFAPGFGQASEHLKDFRCLVTSAISQITWLDSRTDTLTGNSVRIP